MWAQGLGAGPQASMAQEGTTQEPVRGARGGLGGGSWYLLPIFGSGVSFSEGRF